MTNCVPCQQPPGGQACCDPGQTPMCFIRDGVAHTVCTRIDNAILRDEERFSAAIKEILIALAGQQYAAEIHATFELKDRIATFISRDKRVKMTARQIRPRDEGEPQRAYAAL